MVVVENADAPDEFPFSFDEGVETIELRPDGGAVLLDSAGVSIGNVAPPCASADAVSGLADQLSLGTARR